MLRRTTAPSVVSDPLTTATPGSLRDTAMRSGAYLVGREAVGVGIRLVGLVLVLRQMGPASFGIYGAAAAYVLFAATLAQMGAEVFLIRQPGPLPRRCYDEVFTALLVTSTVVVVVGMGLSFLLAPWLRPYGVVVPMRVLLLSVPVNVLWAPMQACIERQFAYRRMGLLELGGDIVLYGTAAPLAFMGEGAWSLIIGFFAWQTWLLVGSMALSGLWPRLTWSSRTARDLVAHGRTYALTTWIYGARTAVLTLIVGTYAGAVGVGLVKFAQRLVTTMNFANRGVHRIGMVAISKARRDQPERLSKALEEGTLFLMVVSALPFAAFGLAARWVVPHVFGTAWLPAVPVYVLLALWAMLRVPVAVQRTLLYAYGRNMPPAITSTIEMVIVCLVGLVAVRDFGIVGFGIASVVAVSSTVYTHFAAHRLVAMRYRRLVLPLIALVPPVFMALVPAPWTYLLLLPPLTLALVPSMRSELWHLVKTVQATVARRRAPATVAPGSGPSVPLVATAAAVTMRPATGAVRLAVAAFRTGGSEMTMNGSAHGAPAPLFPPFKAWRLQAGTVVDPTNPRIADRASLEAYGLRAGPVSRPWSIDDVLRPGATTGGGVNGQEPAPSIEPASPNGNGAPPRREDRSNLAATARGFGQGHGTQDSLDALLLETDPVTGLPSTAVLLARLGRQLGVVRDPGWTLAVVAVQLQHDGAARPANVVPEEILVRVADGLRGELRFDDLVARVGTSTFVAAVTLVGRGADGALIAAHVEGAVRGAAGVAADGTQPHERWSVRSSHTVVPLPCDRDADELVRRVLGGLDG